MTPNDIAKILQRPEARPIVTAKEVKALAIDFRNRRGEILYLQGVIGDTAIKCYNIKWKSLGAGMYEVFLQEKK